VKKRAKVFSELREMEEIALKVYPLQDLQKKDDIDTL